MGRVGTPEDMPKVAIWLCSDASSYITGHALPIEGGWIIKKSFRHYPASINNILGPMFISNGEPAMWN